MRHRLTIALSLVVVLLLATVVAGYQRTSTLTCTTAAFETWDAGGAHGTGACLLYLALGPDVDTVAQDAPAPRTTQAAPSTPESTPAAAVTAPPQQQASATPAPSTPTPSSPTPSSPTPAEPAPSTETGETFDPYGTYEVADFGTHTVTCLGTAYYYWKEVAQFYGEDDSCRAWAAAVGADTDVDAVNGGRNPTFHSSGETQMYFLLLENDAAVMD